MKLYLSIQYLIANQIKHTSGIAGAMVEKKDPMAKTTKAKAKYQDTSK
jgi:hypothetical protein